MVSGSTGRFQLNPKWDHRDEQEVHAVIRSGEREKAIGFLRGWFEKNVGESVTIVDPYFGPGDLWVVRLVMETNAGANVRIVTGGAAGRDSDLGAASDVYGSEWRRFCDQSPPHTEILRVAFVDSGATPIHDRWILSEFAGLRIGTSLNSIGSKLTELSADGQ